MIVNLFSPDGTRDNLYLSNYATIQLKDELSRLPGVGDITYLGQRDYSMRLWLDPEKMASPQLVGHRRRAGHRAAEHAGRRRPDRPAAGRHRPGVSVHDQHDGPAGRSRAVRRNDSQDRRQRPPGAAGRRGPHRAGRARLRPDVHARRPAVGRAVDLSVARLQRAGHRRAGAGQDGGARRPLSRGRRLRDRLRHDAVHQRDRSTRCSRRCATPSCWWRSWCWCFCRTGGRPSFR